MMETTTNPQSFSMTTEWPTDNYEYSDSEFLAQPVWFKMLIVMEVILGAFTNGTLIYLVASTRELRTSPNILLVNLAIGDFIFVVITAPPVISPSFLTSSYKYCLASEFVYIVSFGVSPLSLTAISIECYLAIAKPLLIHRVPKMRATAIICFII